MTVDQLRELLSQAGIPIMAWMLPDETYEPCSLGFVEQNWDAWMAGRPLEMVMRDGAQRLIPRWLEESGDCDNLALGTMAWADQGNALAAFKRGTPRGGLAYGMLCYVAEQRAGNYGVVGGHAINWFVDYDNKVRFFEPGIGREVELTTTERDTAWFGLAA